MSRVIDLGHFLQFQNQKLMKLISHCFFLNEFEFKIIDLLIDFLIVPNLFFYVISLKFDNKAFTRLEIFNMRAFENINIFWKFF